MSPSRRYLQEMRIVGRQVMGVLSPWFGPDSPNTWQKLAIRTRRYTRDIKKSFL